jgi:acetolactate synthase-1/2/3 large subunit
VVATWRRADVVSNDHPLYLGMVGYGAPSTVLQRLDEADAVLVIGSRLSEITTAGYRVPHAGQRWAHVDLEPRGAVADLPRPDLALVADGRAFLRAALERLRGAVIDAESADARSAANAADRAAWEAATTIDGGDWDGPGVHPGRAVATLRRVLPDEAIVTTDAGNMAGWLARGYRSRRPGTFLGPTSGAMGYGLPAAIAAALVHRDRPVVAWAGDGGFAMTMAELETAVRERLRVVAIVLDNQRFGTIRMHQDQRGVDAPVATDLGTVDFAAVARGLGANGVRLDSDAGFEAALRSAIAGDRPTVIQLALDRRWISVDDRPVS